MPFRDVVGHHRLVDLLARSISRSTLPQSLILAGPGGVGKRLVAVATAQALNCTERAERRTGAEGRSLDVDACGACSTCTRIARGLHPDVLVVEPGGACALACLLNGQIDAKGRTVGIVLSGGNVDPALFAEVISGAR